MKHLNPTSKKAQQFMKAYDNSNAYNIFDCYNNPSPTKRRESYLLEQQMQEEGGAFYKIISYNTFHFTAAWITKDGELKVVTARNAYIIDEMLPF